MFCGNMQVTSAYGNSYHFSDHVADGNFAFQAVEEGDYMACFFASEHTPGIIITVDFDWKSGVAAKDWTSVAKKGSVEVSKPMHYMLIILFMLLWLIMGMFLSKLSRCFFFAADRMGSVSMGCLCVDLTCIRGGHP